MKKNLPLITGLAFIIVAVAALEYLAMKKTGGVLCYPLDDTFIHMALAKNFALSSTWGVHAGDWTSTSSSPLFTALLALLFKIFSVKIIMPMVLSSIGSLLILIAMQQELKKHSTLSTANQIICVLVAIIAGTIPAMTLLGMEHTLQMAFILFFVHSVATILASDQKENVWIAAAWAALMTITRYEATFFVIGAFGMLVLRKKFAPAFIIGAAGALPIILFGLFSVSHGAYFIPNSIMIKGNQNLQYFFNGGITIVEKTGAFAGLFAVALIIVYQKFKAGKTDRDFWILCLFLFAAIMHSIFVTLSWFYRYEAYLILLGTFHVGKIILQWLQENGWNGLRKNLVVAAAAILLLYTVPLRGLNAFRNSIRGIYNVYEQQYQMGMFMKQYYYNQAVAANDIGAISFYGDLNTLDLWGLGNNEVMMARKTKQWNNEFLQQLVTKKNVRIAVIYDSWFDKDLSKPWHKVATWELPYSYTTGDIKVSFYGMNDAEADILKKNLQTYQANLPNDVKVEYY